MQRRTSNPTTWASSKGTPKNASQIHPSHCHPEQSEGSALCRVPQQHTQDTFLWSRKFPSIMQLAIVAGEKQVRAPRKFTSVKWIPHGHAKVFLALIEILRPDAAAARALGGSDNHAIVE